MSQRRQQAVFTSMPGPLAHDLGKIIHAWVPSGTALRPGGLWIARWPEYHRQ
jgi:hypothetical protein